MNIKEIIKKFHQKEFVKKKLRKLFFRIFGKKNVCKKNVPAKSCFCYILAKFYSNFLEFYTNSQNFYQNMQNYVTFAKICQYC